MIKDLADNLMTEGKQHVRVEIEKRLSRHADFIKDRLRYKTYLLTGVVPKAAPHAAGRRPSSTSSTKRRRDVLAPAHAGMLLRWCAASRRPAMVRRRDVPRRPAMVCDGTR